MTVWLVFYTLENGSARFEHASSTRRKAEQWIEKVAGGLQHEYLILGVEVDAEIPDERLVDVSDS